MSVPAEMMQLETEEMQREPMSEDEVLSAVSQEISSAESFREDGSGKDADLAMDYFLGKRPGIIDPDVSEYFQSVVSCDVANVVEATAAEIIPALVSDRPAEFDSAGPGDEDQAALESDICNDVLMESGNGFLELATAIKNALLLRLGALEIVWEDTTDVRYEDAEGVPFEAVAQLSMNPDIEIHEIDGAQLDGTMDIRVKQRNRTGRIKIEAVNGLLVSTDCTTLDYSTAVFSAHQRLVSRSDLIAAGFDREIVEELPVAGALSVSDSQRLASSSRLTTDSADSGTDQIQVTNCYYRLDEDRDGIAELRQIVVAGDTGGLTMLSDETTDYHPYAVGAAYILPQQPYGMSVFDKQRQIQDLKSKLWRELLEAGQRASRDRVGLLPGTDYNDWMKSQFGGGIRIQTAPGVIPIPNPQFPAEVGSLQAIADKARSEGGGGALDKSNAENMPVEAGAHGVERMMTAIESQSSMVARTLAETLIVQAYKRIHDLLRTNSPPIPRKVNGQWVQIDPKQWQPRDKVGISVGLTISERQRLAAALGMAATQQKELMQAGSTLANPNTLYRTLVDQMRMMGVNNPETYFVDPNSQEGQQAAQQAQQAQKQAQQQAMEQAQMQAQMQAHVLGSVEQIKAQGRLIEQQVKTQGDTVKQQQDLNQKFAEMMQDQAQFNAQQELNYDKLRLDLVGIEAQYGDTGATVDDDNDGNL